MERLPWNKILYYYSSYCTCTYHALRRGVAFALQKIFWNIPLDRPRWYTVPLPQQIVFYPPCKFFTTLCMSGVVINLRLHGIYYNVSNMYQLLITSQWTVCLLVFVCSRILGTLDLGLREAVSKGRQSVNATLKGKKGDMLDVSYV